MSRLVILAAALSLSACVYVKRSPAIDAAGYSTVVAHSSVRTQTNDTNERGVDVVDTVMTLSSNGTLGEFGERMLTQLSPWLKAQGFRPVWDAERAKRLDKFSPINVGNDLTVLTGMWVDPRGSHWEFGHHLFRQDHFREVASLLKDETPEAFASILVTTGAGGFFLRAPTITVELTVIDGSGKELLTARGFGEGDGSLFILNRSPENLGVAMKRAIESLEKATVEPLEG